jgi:hypothetical protein
MRTLYRLLLAGFCALVRRGDFIDGARLPITVAGLNDLLAER